MTCERIRDELAALVLGEPTPPPPPLVDHLSDCAECRAAYREYLSVSSRLAEAIPRVAPPPHLRNAILSGAKGVSDTHAVPLPPSRWRRWVAGRGAGVAAVILLGVGLGLFGRSVRLENRLHRVESEVRSARREVAETWRAFSGAPATYAGRVTFAPRAEEPARAAEGLLYQRPGGWAAFIRVEGPLPAGETYAVWFEKKGAWEEGSPLLIDADGAGTALYYARGDEARFDRIRIVAGGLTPGEAGWDAQALFEGDAIFENDSAPSDFTDAAPAPAGEADW